MSKLRPLWKHQLKMLDYTLRERHPFLAVEMRLGKSPVTVRRCKLYKPLNPCGLRVLIIAPSSAIGGWTDTLAFEHCSFALLEGARKKRLAALDEWTSEFYVANKEIWLSCPEIADKDWDAVVCDESTFLKNPKAGVTKFMLRNFRDVPHRWALAGKPNPEHCMEWWAQIAWLDGAAFGFKKFWDFRAKCFFIGSSGYDWYPNPGVQDMMHRTVGARCLIMSRKDAGVKTAKTHQTRLIPMPPASRKEYDRAEREFALGDGQTTIWATTRYNWLRKICSNACGKLEELLYLLETEFAGTKLCIWFHYNESLRAVRDSLTARSVEAEYVWGAQSRAERDERRKRWTSSKTCNILLVQQAVAQMGMDLSASDTIIYYEETPSVLATVQGEDRIVHLSKNSMLLYVYLVVADSVDSDLHTTLRAKRWTSDLDLQRAVHKAAQQRGLRKAQGASARTARPCRNGSAPAQRSA